MTGPWYWGVAYLARWRGQHLVRLSGRISPSLILLKNAGAQSRCNLFQSQAAAFLSVTPADDPDPIRQTLQVSLLAGSFCYTTN